MLAAAGSLSAQTSSFLLLSETVDEVRVSGDLVVDGNSDAASPSLEVGGELSVFGDISFGSDPSTTGYVYDFYQLALTPTSFDLQFHENLGEYEFNSSHLELRKDKLSFYLKQAVPDHQDDSAVVNERVRCDFDESGLSVLLRSTDGSTLRSIYGADQISLYDQNDDIAFSVRQTVYNDPFLALIYGLPAVVPGAVTFEGEELTTTSRVNDIIASSIVDSSRLLDPNGVVAIEAQNDQTLVVPVGAKIVYAETNTPGDIPLFGSN